MGTGRTGRGTGPGTGNAAPAYARHFALHRDGAGFRVSLPGTKQRYATMKKLIAFIAAACMALTATAAPPKKEEKGKGKDAKKEAPAKKEVPPMMWDVVIEGTFTDNSEPEIKAMLADLKGLKVESIAKKETTVEAVVSSTQKFVRSDISRALKKNKDYKLKEFKSKKPAKDGDKKEEAAKEEPKKTDAAKPDATKPDAAKPDAAKPDAAKPDAAKPDAAKPDAPKTEEPKKDK